MCLPSARPDDQLDDDQSRVLQRCGQMGTENTMINNTRHNGHEIKSDWSVNTLLWGHCFDHKDPGKTCLYFADNDNDANISVLD